MEQGVSLQGTINSLLPENILPRDCILMRLNSAI